MNVETVENESGFSLLWWGHLDHPGTSRTDVTARIRRAASPVRKFSLAWQSCSFYSHNERVGIARGLLMEADAPQAAFDLVPEYE